MSVYSVTECDKYIKKTIINKIHVYGSQSHL